jgi:hypothetical protein
MLRTGSLAEEFGPGAGAVWSAGNRSLGPTKTWTAPNSLRKNADRTEGELVNTRRIAVSFAGALATLSFGLAACATSSSSDVAAHVMPDGTEMSGSSMSGMAHSDGTHGAAGDGARGAAPTRTASMICSDEEVRDAVRRNLDLRRTPVGLHAWAHRLFSCTYQLEGGDLRLSVKDLDSGAPGRAYFDRLRARLPHARSIGGMAGFGFPSFETPRGDVVFLKDHKTLWVDATRLARSDLPDGATRAHVAYGVAAAVIACWAE